MQSAQTYAATRLLPIASALRPKPSIRCINVVNFIRGFEPRGPVDLMLPVQKQMETVQAENLPATWLLQFNALVSGRFVEYLKANLPPDHEVGIWFEMNEMHCKAAGVAWRGRPGYEWDHYPDVAFTLGYTPGERVAAADVFDALSAERPYREALPLTKVSEIMGEDAGNHLDPACVEALREIYFDVARLAA